MTTRRTDPPTRTLVLGGGGAVGIGWQVGLLLGLRNAGLDLRGADAIVGTSAGAVVGALLSSDRDVSDALTSLNGLTQSMAPTALSRGNDLFLRTMRQAGFDTDARKALTAVGLAAQEADTVSESAYLGLFDTFNAIPWPNNFTCTAVDAGSGELVAWSRKSGVPLRKAIASSCALPMLFPVVANNGHTYFDGGLVNHLNAAAAPPSELLVAISCHPLSAARTSSGRPLAASEIQAITELEQLRGQRRVVAVEPDFREINATPDMMMDPQLALRAVEIGMRQAEVESEAIGAAWNTQGERSHR